MSFGKAVDLLRLAMHATSMRGVCLADIESEFGCVRRTAQRMVCALEEAFPATEHQIGNDGRHYWRLPSRAIASLLSPTADELAAMTAAIAELERMGMASEAVRLRELDEKVRTLIPTERGVRLAVDEEVLLESLGIAARPGPRTVANEVVDDAISLALKGPFHLSMGYQSRTDEVPVQRKIAPYGLLLGSRRYLVGKDVTKDDGRLRHYRVEDIKTAEALPTSFEYPADFNLQAYAQRAFGSYHNDAEYGEVVWKFAPSAAGRARRFLFHPAQETEELDDGSLIVRFWAAGHIEMSWHLYTWGAAVEVLSPPSLAELVHPYRRADFVALP